MRLSKKKKQQIESYKNLVLEKNRALNLISRKNSELRLKLLLAQGLLAGEALAPALKSLSGPALDIGSGNGLPGLLLAILFPKKAFYLCERNRKKAEFLKSAASLASASNAKILCQSAEDINRRFEMIFSQAALPLKRISPVLEKVLAPQGQAFLWQGPSWERAWPRRGPLLAEIFRSYKSPSGEKFLLKVQKKPALA